MIRRIRTYFILIISVFFLTACIHPISKETRTGVTQGLTPAIVSENPSAYINQSILMGGLVLSHTAKPDGSILELLEWNINRWGEPTYQDDSGRRFLVKSNDALDTSSYEKGTLVTLAGTVSVQESKLHEEYEDKYPILDLLEIHLWKSPFRYGIHHYDPANPVYVGSEDDDFDRHPYDPGYSDYPFTPYWYRGYYR